MVAFNNIPSNIRVPLFYAEMDNSAAGTFQQNYRALLIGQTLKNEGLNIAKLATSQGTIDELTGVGSMISEMLKAFRKNESMMEVWVLPIADDAAGVAATGSITFSGTAQESGVLSLYIAGKLISIPVSSTNDASTISSAAASAINAMPDVSVTAVSVDESVTLTAKWKGLTGNDIDIRFNYLGEIGGEKTPTGVAFTISKMSGGVLNPSIEEALANLGDEEFDFIALPYSDTTNLNLVRDFMNDSTGRWSYAKQIYGHVYAAMNADVSSAQTFGTTRNDQHCSIMPHNGTPSPVWETASMLTAQEAKSRSIDPARPTQTLPLTGMLAPDVKDRFTMTERNTLLFNGMSTFAIQSGVCQIERVVTTYQKNAYGQADNSYLDVDTLHTSAYVLRAMRQRITQKYGRHKLADDGARFAAGQPIVTPNIIRAELISLYSELELQGLVENSELFQEHLIVERDKNDVNRINVLFPPDYVNQLRVFAVLNQFRLNY